MENAAIKIWNVDANNRECSEIIIWIAVPNTFVKLIIKILQIFMAIDFIHILMVVITT
jgi:hypothetical protein